MKRQESLVIERERITERISFQIEIREDDQMSYPAEKQPDPESASSDSSEIVHCGARHLHQDSRFPAKAGFLPLPSISHNRRTQ